MKVLNYSILALMLIAPAGVMAQTAIKDAVAGHGHTRVADPFVTDGQASTSYSEVSTAEEVVPGHGHTRVSNSLETTIEEVSSGFEMNVNGNSFWCSPDAMDSNY